MPTTESKTESKPFNDPKPLPPLSEKDIARFWSKVDKSPSQGPKGDCWGWTGAKDKNGYGKFSSYADGSKKQNTMRSHRVAHFIQNGSDTFPNCTLHECDWPPCQRGEHLKPGSNLFNIRERDAKGRQAKGDRSGPRLYPDRLQRGEQSHTAKLTDCITQEIRQKYKDGAHVSDLASQHGIHPSTVYRVASGRSWRHTSKGPIKRPPKGNPGSNNGASVLTEQDVIEIRGEYADGHKQQKLANRFNVCQMTISNIVRRKIWKHI